MRGIALDVVPTVPSTDLSVCVAPESMALAEDAQVNAVLPYRVVDANENVLARGELKVYDDGRYLWVRQPVIADGRRLISLVFERSAPLVVGARFDLPARYGQGKWGGGRHGVSDFPPIGPAVVGSSINLYFNPNHRYDIDTAAETGVGG